MKILHAMSSVNPAIGGPIEGVKQFGRINLSRGHQVEIASLDPPNADYIKDFPLPLHPLGPCTRGYAYSSRYAPWLRENAARFDIVIVNGLWQYNSFAAWRVLHRSSTPYVVFTHGMLDPWFKHTYPLKHLKKCAYWRWGEYRVLRDASGVLFTSEEECLQARKSFKPYSAKEIVMSYGTSSPTGDRETQRLEFFNSFPNLRGKRLVLFMGRIHPKKGCDLALEAFAAVLAADQNWHLVIAGPDQIGWRRELDSLAVKLKIQEQVTWTGFVSGNVKWGLMRSAEVLFLPSHQENFGIAVVEALACGIPSLISNKINIWREIEADGAGIVMDDNLEGASQLLKQWNRLDDNAKNTMRNQTLKCFENRFEIGSASTHLLTVLSKISSQGRLGDRAA